MSATQQIKESGKVALGEMSEGRVAQEGPQGRSEFTYIDISSIDRDTKRIADPKVLPSSKAPSRAKQILKAGDVVVSMTRPNLNAVAIVPPDLDGAIGSTGFHVLRAKDAEPGFLFYAVQTPDFIEAMCQKVQGALYPAVRPRDISSFSLPPFSLAAQRAAVAEIEKQFTRLETGVTALRRVQANLKRYRAAVLKAACEGRLVPTEAELHSGSGVPPLGQKSREKRQDAASTFESGEALLTRILTERRQNWKGRGQYKEPTSSDMTSSPTLPGGWTWTNIGQIGEVGTGATPNRGKSEYYVGGTIPWITSGRVNNPRVDEADQFVTSIALEQCNLTVYPPGTLLLAMYGEGKTRGTASELGIEAATNQALAAIQTPAAIRGFIKVVLWKNYEDVRKSASGGVQPNINLSIVRAIPVPLPPLAEQTRIVAEVERRLSVVGELEAVVSADLQRATRLRQSILQKAFTGELIVS